MHIAFTLFFLSIYSLFSTSNAAVPLIMEADVVINDFEVYWKNGQLLTVSRSSNKSFLPLEKNLETPLPLDIDSWLKLEQDCMEDQQYSLPIPEKPLTIAIKQTDTALHVQVLHKELVLAQNMIQRPSVLCSSRLLSDRDSNTLELAIVWKLGEIKGLSLFRVPEAVR